MPAPTPYDTEIAELQELCSTAMTQQMVDGQMAMFNLEFAQRRLSDLLNAQAALIGGESYRPRNSAVNLSDV